MNVKKTLMKTLFIIDIYCGDIQYCFFLTFKLICRVQFVELRSESLNSSV